VFYDSLLGKLIVWAEDRDRARRRMLRALGEFVLEGVTHNLAFHRWLVAHPEFASGRLSTGFIDEHFTPGALAPDPDRVAVAAVAAALHAGEQQQRVTLPRANGRGGRSAWRWGERPAAPERVRR